jgi:hypothetical protein
LLYRDHNRRSHLSVHDLSVLHHLLVPCVGRDETHPREERELEGRTVLGLVVEVVDSPNVQPVDQVPAPLAKLPTSAIPARTSGPG